VVNDWTKFLDMSHDINGSNYSTVNGYSADAMINETLGGFYELIGLIFLFHLEDRRHSFLYTILDLIDV